MCHVDVPVADGVQDEELNPCDAVGVALGFCGLEVHEEMLNARSMDVLVAVGGMYACGWGHPLEADAHGWVAVLKSVGDLLLVVVSGGVEGALVFLVLGSGLSFVGDDGDDDVVDLLEQFGI